MQCILLFYKLNNGLMKFDATRAIVFSDRGNYLITPGDDFTGIRTIKGELHDHVGVIKRRSNASAVLVVKVDGVGKKRPLINKLSKACNEVVKMSCQLDIGLTWTPNHLYKTILRLDGKRNFKVIDRWEHE